MKTSRNNKNVVNSYLKHLKTALLCPSGMKKNILNDVKDRVVELEKQYPILTTDDLYKEIGTPDEIAKGFESTLEIGNIKKSARKLHRIKLLCWILFILMVLAIIITVIIIKSNETYHPEIISHSPYTGEVG